MKTTVKKKTDFLYSLHKEISGMYFYSFSIVIIEQDLLCPLWIHLFFVKKFLDKYIYKIVKGTVSPVDWKLLQIFICNNVEMEPF